jgi:hypothetical protein
LLFDLHGRARRFHLNAPDVVVSDLDGTVDDVVVGALQMRLGRFL